MKKWLAVLVVLLLNMVARCEMFERPIVVKPCGEVEVSIKAFTEDKVKAFYPESEYTERSVSVLGSDFLNLEDPEWWDKLQTDLVELYVGEREENWPRYFVKKIPPVSWLKENVRREYVPFYSGLVELSLSPGGKLRQTVDRESYDTFSGDRSDRKHILLDDGMNIYTPWGTTFEFPEDSGVHRRDLRFIQNTENDVFLFEYSDGNTYAVLELPEELQKMEIDDLEQGRYETTITAKTYCSTD